VLFYAQERSLKLQINEPAAKQKKKANNALTLANNSLNFHTVN